MNDSAQGPEWFREGYRHIWMPYTQMQNSPMPQAVRSTAGVNITLEDGRELTDGISSWWTACHGYNHPHIENAIIEQLKKMPHVMLAGLSNEPAFNLSRRLAGILPGNLNRVFLSESGSVSVEIAMKMAVQYWQHQGYNTRNKFICFKGGYHGDTIGTMAVGDPDNILHGPFNSLTPAQLVAELPIDDVTKNNFHDFLDLNSDNCAAVILEPLVQGAGGMLFHDPDTLSFIRAACDEHNVLLILDEIMVGFGRTGTMFACEQANVQPDIITLSKALTGGNMALAATIASDEIFEVFLSEKLEDCFMHGPTYTGNALACAAANASLDLFEQEPRIDQVLNIEQKLKKQLEPCRNIDGVIDVRVLGAIGVVELVNLGDMYWMRKRFIEEGCWVRPFGNIIYLMPPFIVNDKDLAKLTNAVVKIVGEWVDADYEGKG
jgi:adenosylmethionine---8-amino-7-oxononanoate aminotransferase